MGKWWEKYGIHPCIICTIFFLRTYENLDAHYSWFFCLRLAFLMRTTRLKCQNNNWYLEFADWHRSKTQGSCPNLFDDYIGSKNIRNKFPNLEITGILISAWVVCENKLFNVRNGFDRKTNKWIINYHMYFSLLFWVSDRWLCLYCSVFFLFSYCNTLFVVMKFCIKKQQWVSNPLSGNQPASTTNW